MRAFLSAGLILIGKVLLFSGVAFSQPANLYTFPGPDVELGPGSTFSSGFHYIGGRGDTIYVLRVTSEALTYCHKSTDGGLTFSSGVQVNSTPSGISPSLKVDTAGVVYVAYQSGGADIYFTKSTDGGQSFATSIKVNDDTIPQTGQEWPSIAVNNKGQIYIAWRDRRTDPYSTFCSASYDSGRTFLPNVQASESGFHSRLQDIAADDLGRVYVVWEEFPTALYLSTRLARSDDSGRTFSYRTTVSDLPVDTAQVYALAPSLAIDQNGLIGVVWEDKRFEEYSLRFSNSSNYGQSFSPSVILDSSSQPQYPSLVWNDGLFYVVWRATHQRTPSGPDLNHIWFSYSRDTGKTFVPLVDAVPDDTNDVLHNSPSLWVNETEEAFVAWGDNRWGSIWESNSHLFLSAGKPPVTKGDLNFDGLITIADVALELNAVFLRQPFPAPFHRADGNCDGRATPADVSLLLFRAFANLSFPCE